MRQKEVEEAKVKWDKSEKMRRKKTLGSKKTSKVAKLWLSMQGNKRSKKRKRGNNRHMRTGQPTKEDKARKPKHKRYIKQTKFKARWNKKGTKGQFKQLINQILSFLRETSSPADIMAQMRANKCYKPED